MYIIQLVHIKNMGDKYNETDFIENKLKQDLSEKKNINDNNKNFKSSNIIKDQIKNVNQVKTFTKNDPVSELKPELKLKINSFNDLLKVVEQNKEAELKYDLERNVKLARFEDGKIEINFNENLNKNFIKKLSQNLYNWTGKRWIISLSKDNNLKTFYQRKVEEKTDILNSEKKSETFKKILEVFPDADLKDVRGDDD